MKNDVVKLGAGLIMGLVLSVSLLNANENSAGNYLITKPYIPATPPGSQVAAGYLQLTNNSDQIDRLLSIEVPFAKMAEIHEIIMDGDVAKMRKLGAPLALQPGAVVSLEPGSLHLMFMGITSPLVAGESRPVTLSFEKGGKYVVDFQIIDGRNKYGSHQEMSKSGKEAGQAADKMGSVNHPMHKDDSVIDSGTDKVISPQQPLKTVN